MTYLVVYYSRTGNNRTIAELIASKLSADIDEIVDDALGIFAVQIQEESRGYDARMLEDLQRAGIEIREGERAQVREGAWGEYTSLWFRKTGIPED